MKKVLMALCLFALSACVVACVNDPTLSDELPESWSTDTQTETVVEEVTDAVVEVSTDTETVVDTQTSTEEG